MAKSGLAKFGRDRSCRAWCVQKVDAERWHEIAKETVASLQGHVIKRLRPHGPNHGVSNEKGEDLQA